MLPTFHFEGLLTLVSQECRKTETHAGQSNAILMATCEWKWIVTSTKRWWKWRTQYEQIYDVNSSIGCYRERVTKFIPTRWWYGRKKKELMLWFFFFFPLIIRVNA